MDNFTIIKVVYIRTIRDLYSISNNKTTLNLKAWLQKAKEDYWKNQAKLDKNQYNGEK